MSISQYFEAFLHQKDTLSHPMMDGGLSLKSPTVSVADLALRCWQRARVPQQLRPQIYVPTFMNMSLEY